MKISSNDNHGWKTTILNSIPETLKILETLENKGWLFRGQSKCFGKLIPSLDRNPLNKIKRVEKIALERQSIDLFRSTPIHFASEGEQEALQTDITTLMVLQHYGVPTRLLDWSFSPYVAAFFSAFSSKNENGEIWGFDEKWYEEKGSKQWDKYPETKKDGIFDNQMPTAFANGEPNDWFVCQFYYSYKSFPRYKAQAAAFSMTSRFGRDHAKFIQALLEDINRYHLYIIKADLKLKLLQFLEEEKDIWRGSIYPDIAGAAEMVKELFPSKECRCGF
jgi:hypothetical protein